MDQGSWLHVSMVIGARKTKFYSSGNLREESKKEPLNPFFGSWYELFEKQLLSYCLGYKFVRWLENEFLLERIAKLKREKIESKILEFLR